jgi:hypothetical protein
MVTGVDEHHGDVRRVLFDQVQHDRRLSTRTGTGYYLPRIVLIDPCESIGNIQRTEFRDSAIGRRQRGGNFAIFCGNVRHLQVHL